MLSRAVYEPQKVWTWIKLLLVPYLILHIVNGLILKWLTIKGLPLANMLLYRGVSCLLWILILAALQKKSPLPRRMGQQLRRGLLAGLALTAVIASYQYLPASTAALMTRFDTPFLVLFGGMLGLGRYHARQRLAAVFCMVLPLFYVFVSGSTQQQFIGFGLGYAGSFMLAVSYVLLKTSAKKEHILAVVLTPALALISFGGVYGLKNGIDFGALSLPMFVVLLIAGPVMYYIYDLTAKLYQILDVAQAEYLTLFAAVALVPLEWLVFDLRVDFYYMFFLLILCGVLYKALTEPKAKKGGWCHQVTSKTVESQTAHHEMAASTYRERPIS